MTPVPTWKTPKFWLTLIVAAAALAPNLVPLTGDCDAGLYFLRIAGLICAGGAAVGYSMARGYSKRLEGRGPRPVFGTTEFWVTLVVAIGSAAPAVFESARCPGDDKILAVIQMAVATFSAIVLGQSRREARKQ